MKQRYQLIYADPAWKYGCWYQSEDVKRNAADHYDVMETKDMKLIPVNEISDKDSVLLMWATYPCLKDAFDLMEVWGYEYKTVAFTWVKRNKKGIGWFLGLGNYTRANAEICLLGTKGKGLPRMSHSVRQILDDRIRKHSQKPDATYARIEELFGEVSKVELFARERREGWDSWGNQLPKDTQQIFRSA